MYLCYIRKDGMTIYDDSIRIFWDMSTAKEYCANNPCYVWYYYGIGDVS